MAVENIILREVMKTHEDTHEMYLLTKLQSEELEKLGKVEATRGKNKCLLGIWYILKA